MPQQIYWDWGRANAISIFSGRFPGKGEQRHFEKVGLELMDHPVYYAGNIADISDYPPEFAINDPNSPENKSWTAAQWSVLRRVGIFLN